MPTQTTAWLDSITELSNMEDEIMTDSNADRHLFKVLGSLGSDVKHSLSLLERSRQDTTQLRMDMKAETNDIKIEFVKHIDSLRRDHGALTDRVDKLEAFQTKMVAYMTILIPVAIAVGQVLAPVVIKML